MSGERFAFPALFVSAWCFSNNLASLLRKTVKKHKNKAKQL